MCLLNKNSDFRANKIGMQERNCALLLPIGDHFEVIVGTQSDFDKPISGQ